MEETFLIIRDINRIIKKIKKAKDIKKFLKRNGYEAMYYVFTDDKGINYQLSFDDFVNYLQRRKDDNL